MAETYYKLATFVQHLCTFRDGKRAYPTEAQARADATLPGTYRVSTVTPDGKRTDGEPFNVGGQGETTTQQIKPRKQFPNHATRPMGGRPH